MESAILIAMNGNDNENDKNCSSSELIPTTTAVSQDNSAAIVISPLEDEDAFPAEPPGAPPLPVNQDGTPMYQYRDFGHIDEDHEEGGTNNNGDSSSAPGTGVVNRGGSESSIRVQKFPVKLYAILAQKEFHDIICWLPHGRSWKVLKPSMFESLVMPLFFEYSNYHSFNRLVNAWSFRRISTGPDRGSYYHELFLRGKPHLQNYMRRLPKTHKKLPMKKKNEPDFYQLDQTNPLPAIHEAPIPGAAATVQAMRAGVSSHSGGSPHTMIDMHSQGSNGGGGGASMMTHHQQHQHQHQLQHDGEGVVTPDSSPNHSGASIIGVLDSYYSPNHNSSSYMNNTSSNNTSGYGNMTFMGSSGNLGMENNISLGNEYMGINGMNNGMNTNMMSYTNGTSNSMGNGMSSNMNGMRNSMSGMSSNMSGMSSNMNGISSNMNGMSSNMNGMSSNMNGMSSNMNGMSSSMSGTRNRMNNMHTGSGNGMSMMSGNIGNRSDTSSSGMGMSMNQNFMSSSMNENMNSPNMYQNSGSGYSMNSRNGMFSDCLDNYLDGFDSPYRQANGDFRSQQRIQTNTMRYSGDYGVSNGSNMMQSSAQKSVRRPLAMRQSHSSEHINMGNSGASQRQTESYQGYSQQSNTIPSQMESLGAHNDLYSQSGSSTLPILQDEYSTSGITRHRRSIEN